MGDLNLGRFSRIAGCACQIVVLQLIFSGSLLGCPTCKDGLHADGSAAAYAMSILFMMGMPFVILSCWVTTIVRLRQSVPKADELSEDGSSDEQAVL